MCSGCCRYIPDHLTVKIPLIGRWIVQQSNGEIGGWWYKMLRIILRKRIRRCEEGYKDLI